MKTIKAKKNVGGRYVRGRWNIYVGSRNEDQFSEKWNAIDWISDMLEEGGYALSTKSQITQADVDAHRVRLGMPAMPAAPPAEPKRVTIAAVNKAIAAEGGKEELIKGKGYFSFIEGDAWDWPEQSVYVYRISDLNLEQWVEAWRDLKKQGDEAIERRKVFEK